MGWPLIWKTRAVWLQAKVREDRLDLWPKLNAGPVCDAWCDICVMWRYISEPYPCLYVMDASMLHGTSKLSTFGGWCAMSTDNDTSLKMTYLQLCFTHVSDMTSRRRLRSSTSHRLDVPPARLSTIGRRAFPVSGATVWNDLPLHVASAPSLAVFRQRLKTFLFSRSYQDTIIWLVC